MITFLPQTCIREKAWFKDLRRGLESKDFGFWPRLSNEDSFWAVTWYFHYSKIEVSTSYAFLHTSSLFPAHFPVCAGVPCLKFGRFLSLLYYVPKSIAWRQDGDVVEGMTLEPAFLSSNPSSLTSRAVWSWGNYVNLLGFSLPVYEIENHQTYFMGLS